MLEKTDTERTLEKKRNTKHNRRRRRSTRKRDRETDLNHEKKTETGGGGEGGKEWNERKNIEKTKCEKNEKKDRETKEGEGGRETSVCHMSVPSRDCAGGPQSDVTMLAPRKSQF